MNAAAFRMAGALFAVVSAAVIGFAIGAPGDQWGGIMFGVIGVVGGLGLVGGAR